MKDKISVIKLGYVGLPLAVSLSNFYYIYGIEVSNNRIEELKKVIDKNKEISKKKILNINLVKLKDINKFDVYIIGAQNFRTNVILKKIVSLAKTKKTLISLFNNDLKLKSNNLNLINL